MKKILTIIPLLISMMGFTQVNGVVIDEKGNSLPYVSVFSPEHNKGTTTNFDGVFNLDIPKGGEVIFSFINFRKDTLIGGENMVITLYEKSIELDVVNVTADKMVGSEVGLVIEKKESTEVESSIGKAELTKKNINNAEDGLKKVSGVTLNSSKINVRGLDDRYNQVTINRFPIPSNNVDQKNLDLGLIPRNFIGNMKIRKSYSPNQWSNIAGAQIDINTDNVTEGLSVGGKLDYNLNNTFNNSINFSYGKKYDRLSYQVIGRYSLNNLYTEGFTRIIDRQGNIKLDYNITNNISTQDIFGSTLLQYKYKYLKIKSVSMIVNSNKTLFTYTDGTHFDYGTGLFTSRVTPTRENLLLQQIIGDYSKNKLMIHIDFTYTMVNTGENNRTQFVYLKYPEGYMFNNIDKLDNHHFWIQNIEHRYGTSFFLKYSDSIISTEFGYNFMGASNVFDYQQRYYNLDGLSNTMVNPYSPYEYISDKYKLLDVVNPASFVEGQTLVHGVYNVTNIKINKLNIITGVRFENSFQGIFYRNQTQPNVMKSEIVDNYDFLPSLVFKYSFNDKNQMKLSTSKTTIRPRFRELTPFLYTEMFAGGKIQGNPNLINSSVYNGDISYELYPTKTQVITLTGFGKYIINPIERVNKATASGRLESYQNGDMAYVVGGELESKFKINKFTIDYNLTLMYSKIRLLDDGLSSIIVTNTERVLQGSTPILSNLDIFYTINNHSFGVVYNLTGSKLFSAGIQGIGDVYLSRRNQLNIVYRYNKENFNLLVGVDNIFNSPFELRQGSDSGIKDINHYRVGINFSVGVTYIL